MKEPDINIDFDFEGIEFDYFDSIEENLIETRYIKPKLLKPFNENAIKYAYAKDLANDICIEKNSRYFVLLNGSFIFGDFIEAIIKKNNWLVDEMIISTLSFSEENIDSLANLLNGNYVEKLDLIVSDYFFSHERNKLIKYAYSELDKNNKFQLSVIRTHCKTCIFKTNGLKIVIHGSANLRTSNNLEQITIEESNLLYDFYAEYQKNIIKHFKTINKTIKGQELWHQVVKK